MALERLKIIESWTKNNLSSKTLSYQTEFETHEADVKNKLEKELKWNKPNSWLRYWGGFVRISTMIIMLAILLIFLWGLVIGSNIFDTNKSTQKHWPSHNQTSPHRPHR